MSECFADFSPKAPKQGWRNYLKYGIWIVWISGVAVCHIFGKGDYTVQPFFMTEHGISVSNIYCYIIYYGIVLLFLIPAIVHGKRANCHYICWMAPFMIFGYKVGRLLRLPQVKIKAKPQTCADCKSCQKVCPMALDVPALARRGEINSAECKRYSKKAEEKPQAATLKIWKFKRRRQKSRTSPLLACASL